MTAFIVKNRTKRLNITWITNLEHLLLYNIRFIQDPGTFRRRVCKNCFLLKRNLYEMQTYHVQAAVILWNIT